MLPDRVLTLRQRLMTSHTIDDLTSCILDFQANIIRVTHRKKTTPVDSLNDRSHEAALKFIWTSSKLQEDRDDANYIVKWRQLGFETEDIDSEFHDVGVLGLDCLVSHISRYVGCIADRPDN